MLPPQEDSINFYGLTINATHNGKELLASVTSHTDPVEMKMARALFTSTDRVLVAGAGYGGTAAMIALLGCRVLAVEANPRLVPLMNTQVRVRGQKIDLLAGALSNDDGEAPFYVSEDWPSSSLDPEWAAEPKTAVMIPLYSVTRLLREHHLNAIMLDVEGAEAQILPSLPWGRINSLVVELHGEQIEPGTALIRKHLTIIDRAEGVRTRILAARRC